MDPFVVDGASILVTGGTGGLGRPLVERLAAMGASVTIASRHAATAAGFHGVDLDLTVRGSAERAVAFALERHGRLDAVIHVAGAVAFGPVTELTDETLEYLFSINALAPIRLARASVPHLPEGGVFVVVSGVVADQPMAGMLAYSSSKAAAAAFVTGLQRETRRSKIRTLDVRLPHTETGLASRPLEGVAPSLPTGLRPEDVADRIIEAMVSGERELTSSDFGRGSGRAEA